METNPPSATGEQVVPSNVSVVVLMGLPASGKSMLARQLIEAFSQTWNTLLVSYDEFVPLITQAVASQQLESDTAKTSTTSSKILRRKFVKCVDFIVKFIKNNVQGPLNAELGNDVKLLESELESVEPVALVGDQVFVDNTQRLLKSFCDSVSQSPCSNDFRTVVLVDDNNYYHSMRNDFFQIAKLSEVGFCIIYCNASLAVCCKRNEARPSTFRVPESVITEMCSKMEEPNPMQNACDAYCIQIDTNTDGSECVNYSLLESVLVSSFNNPLKQREDRTEEIERERRICSENEVHQADLILRKWITKKMNLLSISSSTVPKNGESKRDRKELSQRMNSTKKVLLEKLRAGELKVSYEVHQDVDFGKEVICMFESLKID